MADPGPLVPTAVRRDGPERLVIDWSDGHHSVYSWRHLRDNCPCAGCREEREKPPDPFHVLKPSELAPLKPLRIDPVGRYAYKITWSDGHESAYPVRYLRLHCRCAHCVEELSGRPMLDERTVPADVKPTVINPVGRYAVHITWTDGHTSGIYTYEHLRSLCPCATCTGLRCTYDRWSSKATMLAGSCSASASPYSRSSRCAHMPV